MDLDQQSPSSHILTIYWNVSRIEYLVRKQVTIPIYTTNKPGYSPADHCSYILGTSSGSMPFFSCPLNQLNDNQGELVTAHLSCDQNPGYLLYMRDFLLPRYIGIIISHSYLTNQYFMECHVRVLSISHLTFAYFNFASIPSDSW